MQHVSHPSYSCKTKKINFSDISRTECPLPQWNLIQDNWSSRCGNEECDSLRARGILGCHSKIFNRIGLFVQLDGMWGKRLRSRIIFTPVLKSSSPCAKYFLLLSFLLTLVTKKEMPTIFFFTAHISPLFYVQDVDSLVSQLL